MKLIVTQEDQAAAVIDNWEGPVPRQGDYLYHPGPGDYGQPRVNGNTAGCVRQVIWGIHGRHKAEKQYFASAREPFAEVVI